MNAKVDDDGRTVVKNGRDIHRLKNKWSGSDKERLEQTKLIMGKFPSEKTKMDIEKLENSKRMHDKEFKEFLDALEEFESNQQGGRKKTKTYKKCSNKKKSIKKGRHSRRRQSKKY